MIACNRPVILEQLQKPNREAFHLEVEAAKKPRQLWGDCRGWCSLAPERSWLSRNAPVRRLKLCREAVPKSD